MHEGEKEIREVRAGEGELVAAVLHELRSHLDRASIPRLVDLQRPEGYRVVASFADDRVVAVAGFRVSNNLALGRNLYVDDLVTLPAYRGAGHARALLDWLAAEASRLRCNAVHLDSATYRHRAHRLYLRSGFDITSFHFTRPLHPATSSPIVS